MSKVVLISGTSSGFGYAAAKLLASRGHRVFAGMRHIQTRNAEVAAELSALPNVTVVELEISSDEYNEQAVAKAVAEAGGLDAIINDAGSFWMGVGESLTDEDLNYIFNVDVMGPWRLIRAALPQFREQKSGLIITVSSSLARFSCPFMTGYSAGKHALEGLIHGLKYELKPYNVDVAFIEPGIFPTKVWERYRTGGDQAVKDAWGDLGDIDKIIKGQVDQVFASPDANDPILVAQAMVDLVEGEPGKRPLRVVVDPQAGPITEKLNALQEELYGEFITASGMGGLL